MWRHRDFLLQHLSKDKTREHKNLYCWRVTKVVFIGSFAHLIDHVATAPTSPRQRYTRSKSSPLVRRLYGYVIPLLCNQLTEVGVKGSGEGVLGSASHLKHSNNLGHLSPLLRACHHTEFFLLFTDISP